VGVISVIPVSRLVIVGMRNVSDKRCKENQNTHFVFNKFVSSKNPIVYNVDKYDKAIQAPEQHNII